MGALQQYLDLYDAHRGMIDAGGARPLNSLRPAAREALAKHGLPKAGSENYENIDLDTMLAPDYGLNIDRIPLDVSAAPTFRCDVPMITTAPAICINDALQPLPEQLAVSLPEGVTLCSLRQRALDYPEEIEEYYGRIADPDNPLVALDTMLAQDGLYLRVARGVRLEQPLQLVNILSAAIPLMAVRRVLIVMEPDSEASLLVCDHSQRSDIGLLSLQTIEIHVGRGAHFEYYDIEESSESTSRISTLWLRQEADSYAKIDGITLFNGRTRNEYYCRFSGENASLRLMGMGIEDSDSVASTYTRIDHQKPRCHSNELFKYSVEGNARAEFTGLIYVAPGAVKTEAYQANRNLVGAPTAKMFSKPQLEIYNDDVKCSHGTAIGQLDEMQVFYMRTRGLSEATARLLLRQAFMADVIDGVDIESLRERLRHLVECRFAGAESACSSCKLKV